MSRKAANTRTDIYARITDRIVADLEKGVRPWVQPWSAANLSGRVSRPLRHNGQAYTGLNVLLLWSESVASGFMSSTWMTLRQANELGAHVRKGESGATVVYASRFNKTETDAGGGEVERDIPFLKAYTVFNCDQIDGLADHYYSCPEPIAKPLERIEMPIASSITRALSSVTAATRPIILLPPTTSSCRGPNNSGTWPLSLRRERTKPCIGRAVPPD